MHDTYHHSYLREKEYLYAGWNGLQSREKESFNTRDWSPVTCEFVQKKMTPSEPYAAGVGLKSMMMIRPSNGIESLCITSLRLLSVVIIAHHSLGSDEGEAAVDVEHPNCRLFLAESTIPNGARKSLSSFSFPHISIVPLHDVVSDVICRRRWTTPPNFTRTIT